MTKKAKVPKLQRLSQNALFARRCYYVGSRCAAGLPFCEVFFYGNDFAPNFGYTKVYLKVLLGNKQCCFRDFNATCEQNFDRVRRVIEGAKLRTLDSQKSNEDALFTAVCESLMGNGFLQLPNVTDIKNYLE